jgi:hypothetical protein
MVGFELFTAATTPLGWLLSSLRGFSRPNLIQHEDDYFKSPKQLGSIVAPICSQLLTGLKYTGAPQFKDEDALEALLDYMYKQAVEIGYPLDTPRSSKAFRLGFSLALVSEVLTKYAWSFSQENIDY